MISHLSGTVHGSILTCTSCQVIYYILCSSLHHSHHLASHLVWVLAPSQEGGRGWASHQCLSSLHHLPLHQCLIISPLATFSLGCSRRRGGRTLSQRAGQIWLIDGVPPDVYFTSPRRDSTGDAIYGMTPGHHGIIIFWCFCI